MKHKSSVKNEGSQLSVKVMDCLKQSDPLYTFGEFFLRVGRDPRRGAGLHLLRNE